MANVSNELVIKKKQQIYITKPGTSPGFLFNCVLRSFSEVVPLKPHHNGNNTEYR